jgi:hypothetical protein
MRVGYSKLGRVQQYAPPNWGVAGGDQEAPILLNRLARRNPEVQFVLLGRNDGLESRDIGLPPNVENPYANPDVRDAVKRVTSRLGEADDMAALQSYIDNMRAIWGSWWDSLDGLVLWLGQTDQAQTPIPAVRGGGIYRSLQMYRLHCSYYVDGINRWRDENPLEREPVWLCSDVWNRMKARDLRWPQRHPVLCQYDFRHPVKHYRGDDTRDPAELGFGDVARWSQVENCWSSTVSYRYSGLELDCAVPSNLPFNGEWEGRGRFGVLINQSRAKSGRGKVLRDWVKPLSPEWVHGNWSESRLRDANWSGQIATWPWHGLPQLFGQVRSTLAVPIRLDLSWATPKIWEIFALGTACFLHPTYDSQGHVLPTLAQCRDLPEDDVLRQLAERLRVTSPQELERRVDWLNSDREAWEWIVTAQRALFNQTFGEQQALTAIEQRLGIVRRGHLRLAS